MTHETIRQILSGHELPGDTPRCCQCGSLLEGARVVVCARSMDGAAGWGINTVWCREHAPTDVPETPHGETALAEARVWTLADVLNQTHTHALIDVVVTDATLGEQNDRKAVQGP